MSDEQSPRILRATPVMIELAASDGTTRQAGLRFDANVLAMIEEHWAERQGNVIDMVDEPDPDAPGETRTVEHVLERNVTLYGIDAWQFSMTKRPFGTIRDTLALALGEPFETIGDAMIPSEVGRYGAAIGAAMAIANGVDPTVAMKALEAVDFNPTAALAAALGAPSETPPSTPGPTGSTAGPAPSDPSTSSGG